MTPIITLLRSMVLVELRDAAEREGAIVIVRADRPPSTRAKVIAVGDEVRDLGPGVNVVISRLQGIEIAGGALLIDESAVLATEPADDWLHMKCEKHMLPMTAECLSDELIADDADATGAV